MIKSFSNIGAVLKYRAEEQPQKKVFIYLENGEKESRFLTYEELYKKSQKIAKKLTELKLVGERAVLLFPQGLDFITALFGCFFAGVIAIPAYPPNRNKLNRLEGILSNSGAKFILSNQEISNKSKRFSNSFEGSQWILIDGIKENLNSTLPQIDSEDIAFLQYTSGSTGEPKGVIISHQNIMVNSQFLKEAFELTEQDICVSWLPLFHDMGLIDGVIQPLYSNYPVYLMSPTDFVRNPIRWLKALSDFKATRTGGPNFAFDLCSERIQDESIRGLDLSKVKCLYNGSEPISSSTLTRFVKKFESTGLREEVFYPCYGMAEATLQVTGVEISKIPVVLQVDKLKLGQDKVLLTENEANSINLVSCGFPRVDTRIQIINPSSNQLAKANEVGEIWLKGESISKGYWNNQVINKNTFYQTIEDTNETGYYKTGDLGFIHNNELYITGRIKELIIIRGKNYYPQDIERIVQDAHPALRGNGTAAFSIVDRTEKLIIVQEIKRTFLNGLDDKVIFDAIRSKISNFIEISVDAIVLVRPLSIPKTTSGKIMRKQCRKDYESNELSKISIWKAPISTIIDGTLDKANSLNELEYIETFLTKIFAQKSNLSIEEVGLNVSFLDLGIDSIYAVDLTVEIEKELGLKISTTAFWELETIKNISNYLYEKKEKDGMEPV